MNVYLILVAAVVVFGIAVLVISRRRSAAWADPAVRRRAALAPKPPPPPVGRPDREAIPGAPGAPPVMRPHSTRTLESLETEVDLEATSPRRKPNWRRSNSSSHVSVIVWVGPAPRLAGVFGGVRARDGITADTWDDLEEALLKADVGVASPTNCSTGCGPGRRRRRSTIPMRCWTRCATR